MKVGLTSNRWNFSAHELWAPVDPLLISTQPLSFSSLKMSKLNSSSTSNGQTDLRDTYIEWTDRILEVATAWSGSHLQVTKENLLVENPEARLRICEALWQTVDSSTRSWLRLADHLDWSAAPAHAAHGNPRQDLPTMHCREGGNVPMKWSDSLLGSHVCHIWYTAVQCTVMRKRLT